jgi:CDP-diacylglycerol---glycerol-3-phosphate 3-phosphatidyltransferase
LSIANYLTFVRLVISPIFLIVYVSAEGFGITPEALPYVLMILLAISELSDAFDGYFARKYNQVTDFGKILDPMADSIARTTVFLAFTQDPVRLPVLLVFIFLYRDSVVSTLRTICALKGIALAARISGKIKAVIQAIVAFVILFLMVLNAQGQLSNETLSSISTWFVSVAAIYTLFSGLDYVYSNRQYISKLLIMQGAKPQAFSKLVEGSDSV